MMRTRLDTREQGGVIIISLDLESVYQVNKVCGVCKPE